MSAPGKGSQRRPAVVPDHVIEENWRRIFDKKHEEKPLQHRREPYPHDNKKEGHDR